MANPHPSYKIPKGTTPNPNGRPKREWTWASEYEKAVEKKNLDGTPIKEGIADSLAGKALEGDTNAIRELANRMDGMPTQGIDAKITGNVKIDIDGIIGIKQSGTTPTEATTGTPDASKPSV